MKKKKTNQQSSRIGTKRNDNRVSLILKVKKGKINPNDLKLLLKYALNEPSGRNYVLQKLGKKYIDETFAFPFPQEITQLGTGSTVFIKDKENIDYEEIKWYFDIFEYYINDINEYLLEKESLERFILFNNNDEALELLDSLEEQKGLSIFIIQSEFYINEKLNESDKNKELIKDYSSDGISTKLLILLEHARLKIDRKISTWQYNLILEQHKKLYKDDEKEYLDYIIFKLDPFFHLEKISHLPFINYFDSDFSLVDRYESLKNIIPKYLINNLSDKVRNLLIEFGKKFRDKTQDKYWEKLLVILGASSPTFSNRDKIFNSINNKFFNGDLDEVLNDCKEVFQTEPHYFELYSLFIKAIISTEKEINDFVNPNTELNKILILVKRVLEKKDSYLSDKEKIQKKYSELSQFTISFSILDFIYTEYKIEPSKETELYNFLNSPIYDQRLVSLIDKPELFLNSLKVLDSNNTVISKIENFLSSSYSINQLPNFETIDLLITALFKKNQYQEIIKILDQVQTTYPEKLNYEVNYTWLIKNYLKCYQKLKLYDIAAEVVVNYFFEKNNIYEHFFQQDLIDDLLDLDGESIYENIAIPILFQLFNQSQPIIYDGIANFLLQNNASVPSELIDKKEEFEPDRLIFFFEKVCIMDNIESSPFINTIEALEGERIIILNFLKEINSQKKESYNEEILEIIKQTSIRKGLQQIHESRIYVDTDNIEKIVESELKEIFERYLELNDIKYVDLSALSLGKSSLIREIKTTFYLKDPIEERDYFRNYLYNLFVNFRSDPNVVEVPYIRYQYFLNIFETLKDRFVFDEDYGFKSFLSMRIRHGTFPNVIRSVFENNLLVSSKLNNTTEYNDIEYWKNQLKISEIEQKQLQKLLKGFSESVDNKIDLGLQWISVKVDGNANTAMFDFDFFDMELVSIYQNRIGRITEFKEFIKEVFLILFERLENILVNLRNRITKYLLTNFVSSIDELQKEVELIGLPYGEFSLLNEYIIKCSTEIQVKLHQVEKWFNVSKNKYIEEFPIEMILETSKNYINSINANALDSAQFNIINNCNIKFKGKHFESFGDIFINIFSNIVKYNRDLKEALVIDINISSQGDDLSIYVKNNLSNSIDFEHLKSKVEEANLKIEDYKNGTSISYEDKSGYPKICKSVAVDLGREKYIIKPNCTPEYFDVEIQFNTLNLYK